MQLQCETNLLNIWAVLHTCYYLHWPLLEFPLYIGDTCTPYILYNHQFFCYLHTLHMKHMEIESFFVIYFAPWIQYNLDIIPSTTPGAEPPRDARDSGSARSHSMHLETISSDRP